MSKFLLQCRGCGKKQNNKAKHFPITLRNKDTIIGYLCLKCTRRNIKSGAIKLPRGEK